MIFGTVKGATAEVKLWTPLEEIESVALDQLKNIASLPWVFHHVAAMPDVHFGIGATVGSVIAMKGAVTPAAVGVDIGCGMGAILTDLKASDLPDSLRNARLAVEEAIPTGFSMHKEPSSELKEDLATEYYQLNNAFKNLTRAVQDQWERALLQLGTLGGGNHFIELCTDTSQNIWLMLHSGSRGIGNKLASYHMAVAKKLAHNENLPDKDLAVFLAGTPEMLAYAHDLLWAQRYAMLNRKVMMRLYVKAIEKALGRPVHSKNEVWCHHNYVSKEVHFGEEVFITRKGAIRAGKGELGIIPGSMGAKSFIVRGLGNPESFESASHGAGRKMSRTKARKTFTEEDLSKMTVGVECRKDKGVLDEIPAAYKDIDTVMANQRDLVEVVAELKQLLCVKGES
jgi:tRNA-splicing ligase RtcB